MANAALDLGVFVGQQIGHLTILEKNVSVRVGAKSNRGLRCLCACGKECLVPNTLIKRGERKSCGCGWGAGVARKRNGVKHGKSRSPEYFSWKAMRSRCHRPSDPAYDRYGGRGITVCDRWLNSFEAFYADMGPRPASTWLERIDNEGGYYPGNCKWGTFEEQGNNKRSSVFVEFRGTRRTITQWGRLLGISHDQANYAFGDRHETVQECAIRYGVELI